MQKRGADFRFRNRLLFELLYFCMLHGKSQGLDCSGSVFVAAEQKANSNTASPLDKQHDAIVQPLFLQDQSVDNSKRVLYTVSKQRRFESNLGALFVFLIRPHPRGVMNERTEGRREKDANDQAGSCE
ncbi:MAG: hypothetical protein PHY12_14980 [Eubacteriales bacterium]|nr:hypothetical protein [Eubacteriales bacterium]